MEILSTKKLGIATLFLCYAVVVLILNLTSGKNYKYLTNSRMHES